MITITNRQSVRITLPGLSFFLLITLILATGFIVINQQPEENRFKRVVLVEKLHNPMELKIAPDGDIYMIESNGRLSRVNPQTKTVVLLGVIKNKDNQELGLIGMALDPGFEKNHWIYVQYFLPQKESVAQVSRFTITNNALDLQSEKKYVQIPYNETCCHVGGSLAFNSKGDLYFSTGDNSDAFKSLYGPMDDSPGREFVNSLRTSANSMDLRGKICRIHPEENGSFSVPKGNLFKDAKDGRPEIYVMGCRNPFRIFVDKVTDILYWGEVGPDAGRDSTYGPRGYDEFNIAGKAGNYGWPMMIGNNKPYANVDYVHNIVGPKFSAEHPVNNSRLNTGIKELPPAQKATIWYPYKRSDEFPNLGEGGRTAIGGPVYHYNPGLRSTIKFPAYFDNKWFIADWMRNWIKAVSLNKEQQLQKIEDFMPSSKFFKPVNMAFSPKDGALYMLEFGDAWGPNNEARLVRIEYIAGNRRPVAKLEMDKSSGRVPLMVKLSAKDAYDDDHDVLKYAWKIDKLKVAGRDINYKFSKNGLHAVTLTVTDPSGASSTQTKVVKVGNSMPLINIDLENHTFYDTALSYNVNVSDAEDGRIGKRISPQSVKVSLDYSPKLGIMTTNSTGVLFYQGEVLMNESDCKSCHKITGSSVGPSFIDVANRYLAEAEKDDKIVKKLANKIIAGGNGVWFKDHAMSAHPQLTINQATEIVHYILSLGVKKSPTRFLPPAGNVELDKASTGFYTLKASYTDKGGNSIQPLTATTVEVLRNPKITADDFDEVSNLNLNDHALGGLTNSYGVLKNIDLTGIKKITLKARSLGGSFEAHLDSLKGRQVSFFQLQGDSNHNILQEPVSDLVEIKGKHDLYIVYRNEIVRFTPMYLDWVYFQK
ncbi:MAG: PQQ-dependent sugar dehydrogenase [Bacteroidota bacterium]